MEIFAAEATTSRPQIAASLSLEWHSWVGSACLRALPAQELMVDNAHPTYHQATISTRTIRGRFSGERRSARETAVVDRLDEVGGRPNAHFRHQSARRYGGVWNVNDSRLSHKPASSAIIVRKRRLARCIVLAVAGTCKMVVSGL